MPEDKVIIPRPNIKRPQINRYCILQTTLSGYPAAQYQHQEATENRQLVVVELNNESSAGRG